MAGSPAIAVAQSIFERTDKQIRDILETYQPGAEVDTINVVIGDGLVVLTTGIKAALRVDFNAVITGSFVHEFDGTTGSVVLDIAKSPAYVVGVAPTFTSIVASAPPTITSARYAEDTTLTGWTTDIARGDVLRFSVTSITSFTRLLIALRIRRLEP
jgi:hypothetical protein